MHIMIVNKYAMCLEVIMENLLFLQVFKETKQKRENILELSSTFLPHCNRQKLLEFILSFVVL